MQRLLSFAATGHGRSYMTSSSFFFFFKQTTIINPSKLLFSTSNNNFLHQSSFSNTSFSHDDDITASEDFQKVMSVLSNAPPHGHGYEIIENLNALDLTTLLQQHQQHFVFKVIQTSWQTKLAENRVTKPYNFIHFVRWAWKKKIHLITTSVLESLVSSICVPTHKPSKNDIYFLWDLLKKIGHNQTGLLNARILNKLIEFLSIMGREGNVALEVFRKFEAFQCVPNQDTYYFTLQALLTTTCNADMTHQASSICQKMMLLLPHDDGGSSSQAYNHLLPSPDDEEDVTECKDFWIARRLVNETPPFHKYVSKFHETLGDMDLTTRDILEIMETSGQIELIETTKVSRHNLIHFMKWVWRRRDDDKLLYKDLVTTPVLESLVSAICCDVPNDNTYYVGWKYSYDFGWDYPYFVDEQRTNDQLFLWDFLKHISHYQTGLLNAQILNQLIDFFRYMVDNEKATKVILEVFHKFEFFQCTPNQDTYTLTLQHLFHYDTICSTDMLQEAASICQKMLFHPETLFPDDGYLLRDMLTRFSENNMVKEAHALYLGAKEKLKRNPEWSLEVDMLLPDAMIKKLCSKKETVHLALKILTDMAEEVEDWEYEAKGEICWYVIPALWKFKDFDAAKQLIFKMTADDGSPLFNGESVFNEIIIDCVKAGEVGQALEMVILMESMGLCTCDTLMFYSDSIGMLQKNVRKILEEAKRKDSKLIIALLYHTLIVGYFKLEKFDEALKLLTQMKEFGVSGTNLDEYHKLMHSLHLKAMDRKISREQLKEMEPIDREMAEKQLAKMSYMDRQLAEEKLEELKLNIKASF